jgi:hydrogenase maturation protein HypF
MAREIEGRHIRVSGIVQGVGFRPFVYELATRYQLVGWVLNNSSGVEIKVVGPSETLAAFVTALQAEKPPLATIDRIDIERLTNQEPLTDNPEPVFQILHSESQPEAFVPISPDIAICDACLGELFDPADRRYRYPFINCTNCGPRFTIIGDIPYDRPLTTMAAFPMCPDCQGEYEDPRNRRFHAQPNACAVCGPRVTFSRSAASLAGDQRVISAGLEEAEASQASDPHRDSDTAIRLAQEVIAAGGIVAVKGLGGFHLACDATSDTALSTLRERKGRVDKPFAVMARDVAAVEAFAEVSPEEAALLSSKERPILLLKKKASTCLSDLVAPGNQYVGVMLPYTPLHYLLLTPPDRQPHAPGHQPPSLVMTSGNFSEEPIVKDNATALERLATLADAFLLHDRDIHIQCDDSVVRIFEGRELPVRRSRGYAPFPVRLPFPVKEILAVGGELKNTFCLTRDDYAFMSQHIGDMENLETLQAFEAAVGHFLKLFRVEPGILACDMHPGYLSTKWAQQVVRGQSPGPNTRLPVSNLQRIEVQHHHAHLAAIMAEHGLDGTQPVIGFCFDGTGYGPDRAIWGGELLLVTYRDFSRIAHLKYVPLPGGDAAVKRPYRTALAHLWAAGVAWDETLPPVRACSAVEQGVIKRQLETGLNSVPTSSMGRLFDAVASLAGVRQKVTYEAQAAIEFEALMADGVGERYAFGRPQELNISPGEDPFEIEAAPVVRAVAADVRAGLPGPVISAKFHHAVADVVRHLSLWLRENKGINTVALSGGVFQNVRLLELTVQLLNQNDFEVLTHRLVPPNDGGLALGQAMIAQFNAN